MGKNIKTDIDFEKNLNIKMIYKNPTTAIFNLPTELITSVTKGLDTDLTKTKGGETSVKATVKILKLIKENKEITALELANKIGVTKRSIERNVQKLQKEKKLSKLY